MYLAGVSEQTGEQALKLWHLRNATSFNGCLKEVGLVWPLIMFLRHDGNDSDCNQVYINAKLVDFLQAAKSRHKVAPGCNMYQV